ncbi:hypothetical protein NQ318_014811 [Aromia moschata]|uniref:Uncharacterized protein n=1 Tax=Aromia moschata TaxID=1265417 RepID=A0AAV8ZDZ1_9CUCU|nr:hypothetical protein NQ318_014811 [Aromia moschata]
MTSRSGLESRASIPIQVPGSYIGRLEDFQKEMPNFELDPLNLIIYQLKKFDNYWKACRKIHMDEIKNMDSTTKIFEKWPFYTTPSGYRLFYPWIDMDFDALNTTGDGLLSNWESKKEHILKFLISENNVKDKNSRNATILWAIHGYLVPTNRTVRRDQTGKKSVIKFTIKDSQESFMFLGASYQVLENHLEYLRTRKSSVQPFIVLVDGGITSVKEIENVKYLGNFNP